MGRTTCSSLDHATSKIIGRGPLRVACPGFRCERCQHHGMSLLRIPTRERGATSAGSSGWRGPDLPGCASGCRGTLIEMRDLFHSVPARLKFLRSSATELGHCVQVAARLALACPSLRIRLRHAGRDLLRLPPSADAADRLREYLGREFCAGLVPVRGAGPECAVAGFVSRPGAGRPGVDYQQIFVNGRPVRDPLLAQGC
jgi:DNA mismatch repair protein MutL